MKRTSRDARQPFGGAINTDIPAEAKAAFRCTTIRINAATVQSKTGDVGGIREGMALAIIGMLRNLRVKNMSEKSNEEINRIITEKLFGRCWHTLRVNKSMFPQLGDNFCAICREYDCDKANFCNSDADIREAREKLAEKGLQKEFRNALYLEVGLTESHRWAHLSHLDIEFDLIHSSPESQARAIVRVLEGL